MYIYIYIMYKQLLFIITYNQMPTFNVLLKNISQKNT